MSSLFRVRSSLPLVAPKLYMRSHDLLGWAHVFFQCYLETVPRPLLLSKMSIGKLGTLLLSQPFNKHMKENGPSVSDLGSFIDLFAQLNMVGPT